MITNIEPIVRCIKTIDDSEDIETFIEVCSDTDVITKCPTDAPYVMCEIGEWSIQITTDEKRGNIINVSNNTFSVRFTKYSFYTSREYEKDKIAIFHDEVSVPMGHIDYTNMPPAMHALLRIPA